MRTYPTEEVVHFQRCGQTQRVQKPCGKYPLNRRRGPLIKCFRIQGFYLFIWFFNRIFSLCVPDKRTALKPEIKIDVLTGRLSTGGSRYFRKYYATVAHSKINVVISAIKANRTLINVLDSSIFNCYAILTSNLKFLLEF